MIIGFFDIYDIIMLHVSGTLKFLTGLKQLTPHYFLEIATFRRSFPHALLLTELESCMSLGSIFKQESMYKNSREPVAQLG